MKSLLFSICVLFAFSSLAASPAKQSPADIQLAKLQASWDKIKSFKADFVQLVSSKAMQGLPPDETKGVIYVERPSKLRWESQTDGSLQILSDDELKVIHKNERGTTLVDIYGRISNSVGAKSLNFLTGKAKFAVLYDVVLVGQSPKKVTLKLTPRDTSRETYIAEINKAGYFLETLTTDTEDTSVVMKFSNVRRNLTLDKTLFEYRAQPTDIVHRQ